MEEYKIKAEQLKFIAGEETLNKIRNRYGFMKECDILKSTEKMIVLQLLFNCTAEETKKYILDFSERYRNAPSQGQIADYSFDKKIEIFWNNAVGAETRDWKHWLRYGPQSVKGSKEWMQLEEVDG
jgi:hypothetical protein